MRRRQSTSMVRLCWTDPLCCDAVVCVLLVCHTTVRARGFVRLVLWSWARCWGLHRTTVLSMHVRRTPETQELDVLLVPAPPLQRGRVAEWRACMQGASSRRSRRRMPPCTPPPATSRSPTQSSRRSGSPQRQTAKSRDVALRPQVCVQTHRHRRSSTVRNTAESQHRAILRAPVM